MAEEERQTRVRSYQEGLIRDSVRHKFDDFSGRHFVEATTAVAFTSADNGSLDGEIQTLLQLEFTKDSSVDLVFVGFQRVGTDWRWLNYFRDQLFLILGGNSHEVADPHTYFQVVDGGVIELVGFYPNMDQVELMISDKEWRVRAGLWEAKPTWPTHEVFREALNRRASILSGGPAT